MAKGVTVPSAFIVTLMSLEVALATPTGSAWFAAAALRFWFCVGRIAQTSSPIRMTAVPMTTLRHPPGTWFTLQRLARPTYSRTLSRGASNGFRFVRWSIFLARLPVTY